MTKYPEAEKWAKVPRDASAILQFLEWRDYHPLELVGLNYQQQVEKYFEIDAERLEAERRQMLEELQA
jgi:hypothetical protein